MKAIVYDSYGAADVVRMAEVAKPVPGPGEVLVRVHAATVTTADWRLRAAAFPGVLAVAGRLMFGVFGPRKKVLGNEFSGVVEGLGGGVSEFALGDAVFGFRQLGGHAEYLVMPASGAVLAKPAGLSHGEAASLPFGGLTALVLLRDFIGVRPGMKVAVIGASGGVGLFAVQIAKALGAEVTGVASGANREMVLGLGADRFVDYRTGDIAEGDTRFDVVLDTVGVTRFSRVRRILTAAGVFAPLNIGLREIGQALWTRIRGGKRVIAAVSGDTKADLAELVRLVLAARLRPVVAETFPLGQIVRAYGIVEGRHRSGAVVLDVAGSGEMRATA